MLQAIPQSIISHGRNVQPALLSTQLHGYAAVSQYPSNSLSAHITLVVVVLR